MIGVASSGIEARLATAHFFPSLAGAPVLLLPSLHLLLSNSDKV